MSRFLSVVHVNDAREIISRITKPLCPDIISLSESNGRILAEDILSDIDIPGFDRSTVDGYAVHSPDTTGSSESLPVLLTLIGRGEMGVISDKTLNPGTVMYIPTGGVLPEGADAVVMVEHSEELDNEVLIQKPAAPGENIIRKGEDFRRGEETLKKGTLITSRVMGILAACGKSSVSVLPKPRVAIISTGNEIITVDSIPKGGEIRDVNSFLCNGFIQEHHGIPKMLGIIPDERVSLEDALNTALQTSDLVLISGGSSKGERDMGADVIASFGEVLIHGIALSPGKPTIIGNAGSVPIIGLPGHPVSAYIVLHALVADLMSIMTGIEKKRKVFSGKLTLPVHSARGREDYIRASYQNGLVTPHFGKSGLTNTLINSNGFIRVPAEREGFEKDDLVDVIEW